MKRFILIALACILPSFNNAFAAAERANDLLSAARECCNDKTAEKKVQDLLDKYSADALGLGQEQEFSGKDAVYKAFTTYWPTGYNPPKATMLDMVRVRWRYASGCKNNATCKSIDNKLVGKGAIAVVETDPTEPQWIYENTHLKPNPKLNGNNTTSSTSTSKPESKPASQPNNNADVDDGPIIETTLQAEEEPATVAAQQKPAEEKPVENPVTTTGTITYELNDGTLCSNAPTTYTIGQDKDFECKPTKQYYNFGGWFRDANFTRSAAKQDIRDRDMPTTIQIRKTDSGNLTFYAKWNRQTAIVKYDCGDFKNCGCDRQDFWVGESGITLCAPNDRPGFEFEGWKHNGEIVTAETFELKAGSTTTLHAVWKPLPKTDEINVSGRVVDVHTGKGIESATVQVKDNTGQFIRTKKGNILGNITESDGTFTIPEPVPNNAILRISHAEYAAFETNVKKNVQISLTPKMETATTMPELPIPADHFSPCTESEKAEKHIKNGLRKPTEETKTTIENFLQQLNSAKTAEERKIIEDQYESYAQTQAVYNCIPEECMKGYGNEDGTPIKNEQTGMWECPEQKVEEPAKPTAPYVAEIVPLIQAKGPDVFEKLSPILKKNFTGSSVWKNDEGKFNTARLASDSVAATVLGTVGGVVTSVVMKKNQVKKGFEDMKCTIAGQNVAAYGDEFKVGLVPMP